MSFFKLYLKRMCLFQITDSTLIQLSIHCPRLQVLVSLTLKALYVH